MQKTPLWWRINLSSLFTLCDDFFLNYNYGTCDLSKLYCQKSNNLVIKADALHYKTDILSNTAVLVALALVQWTNFHQIDAIFGLGIGIYVAHSAFGLLKKGFLSCLIGH